MRVLNWGLPLLMSLLIWTGCATPRAVEAPADMPGDFGAHSTAEVITHLHRDSEQIESFRGNARLSFESPEQSGRFSAELHHRRNDSLFLSLSPGFGIEAARALVTPDSFYVYERLNRRLTYGALSDADAQLPAPLLQDNLIDNMLGLGAPDPATEWEVTTDGNQYQLASADGRERFVVDPRYWRVVRYEARAADGSIVEERSFSDFVQFDGVTLPRQVVLRLPAEESTVAITYRDINLNPSDLRFDLRANNVSERVQVSARTN